MSNYNLANYDHPRLQNRLTDRNMEIMTALNAYSWDTYHGSGRLENLATNHILTNDPRGLAYLALVNTNIISSDRVPNDIKLSLARILEFYFCRFNEQYKNTGVYGNLSLGSIVQDHNSKLTTLEVVLFRIIRREDKTIDYIFNVRFIGGNIEANSRLIFTSNGNVYKIEF